MAETDYLYTEGLSVGYHGVPLIQDIALSLKKGEFINFIACDTIEYRKKQNKKMVKKTLTIPEWLNEEATERNINFSQALQEALVTKIES